MFVNGKRIVLTSYQLEFRGQTLSVSLSLCFQGEDVYWKPVDHLGIYNYTSGVY